MGNQQDGGMLARMPSGIPGFDEITGGGLPRRGVTVVLGNAGAGKTVFSTQVLAAGVRNGEPGVLVAFEESADQIVANTRNFSWGEDIVAGSSVHVLDARLADAVEAGGPFDLIGLLALVAAKAKMVGARCVVFDGLDVLLGYLGNETVVRREIFRLREWVHESGLAGIITAKLSSVSEQSSPEYDFLQFMADCVVTLHHRVIHGTALRFVRVAKYRGVAHSANEFPLAITESGLEIATAADAELSYPASSERISTGVERLDAMLSGGYHRGSSILITGVPGTAKTTLAAAFAEASVKRGERTVYVSFDEAPAQIVRNVESIGIRLGPHLDAGTLRLHSFRRRVESPEAQVARIRTILREFKPQNLVIDPLSALSRYTREEDGESAAFQLLDLSKSAGITIVSTSLLGNAIPLSEQTPLNISTIADTWMHVTYVDQGGERNRALTIIKARGTSHSNQVRELVVSDKGVTLADVYAVGGEVLMGTRRWEKENEERRSRSAAKNVSLLREQKAELALEETAARLRTLSHQQKIQETELQQVREQVVTDADTRAGEDDELLQRRHADPTCPPSTEKTDSQT